MTNLPYAPEDEPAFDMVATFWYGQAKMCGCGDPVGVLAMIRDELAHCAIDISDRPDLPRTPERYLLAYSLDAWGLTEHGSGIGWPWLTDEGEALLKALRSVDLDMALEFGSQAMSDAP